MDKTKTSYKNVFPKNNKAVIYNTLSEPYVPITIQFSNSFRKDLESIYNVKDSLLNEGIIHLDTKKGEFF